MKLKNIFLSLVLSLLTLSNSFAMKPVGLINGTGICYANATLQLLFAIPTLKDFLLTKNTPISNKLLELYDSYYGEERIPNNELKMEIIQDIMGENIENISVQYQDEFLEKLLLKIDPETSFIENLKNMGIIYGANENHIANVVQSGGPGGHYFAEIKHNGQWYRADDNRINTIDAPTNANLNDQVKQVISISLSNGMDINNNYDEYFEYAKVLSLSEQTSFESISDHNSDEDLAKAIALSLSESANSDEAMDINQLKLERAKHIIEHEQIYSLDNLGEVNGLIVSIYNHYKLISTLEYFIKDTNFFSELGLEVLAEMISHKM